MSAIFPVMLAELGDVQPTYVIFYDLSRVARDEFDAFWLLREIEACGSKLESTLERIDNDDTGMLVYTVLAGVNAHRSRMDGRKVKMGLERKFADGGSHGPARIGYLNSTEVAGQREIATIAIDESRASLIRRAFDLAATGAHTITTITEILEEDGLRTRGTLKRPSRPLSRSMVHRILRDDYYTGVVTRDGIKREGRHEAIIDRETFEQVSTSLTLTARAATAPTSTLITSPARCSAESAVSASDTDATAVARVTTTSTTPA